MDTFVQLGGTEPAGPNRLDTRRIKLALAASARTRKWRLLCDTQTQQRRQFAPTNKITSLRLSRKIDVEGGHQRWQLYLLLQRLAQLPVTPSHWFHTLKKNMAMLSLQTGTENDKCEVKKTNILLVSALESWSNELRGLN